MYKNKLFRIKIRILPFWQIKDRCWLHRNGTKIGASWCTLPKLKHCKSSSAECGYHKLRFRYEEVFRIILFPFEIQYQEPTESSRAPIHRFLLIPNCILSILLYNLNFEHVFFQINFNYIFRSSFIGK